MKAKTKVKHTNQSESNPPQKGSDQKHDSSSYSPAVPISVYRDLARELDVAKRQLSAVKAQNSTLQHQNQVLRTEVTRIIQSTANLQTALQTFERISEPATVLTDRSSPQRTNANYKVPRAERMADNLIAELDKTLTADISTRLAPPPQSMPTSDPSDAIVDGPFCEVTAGDPLRSSVHVTQDNLIVEHPTTPPNPIALDDEKKSQPLGGVWLPLTIVFVIITAFSAGFLIVLPFIQSDR